MRRMRRAHCKRRLGKGVDCGWCPMVSDLLTCALRSGSWCRRSHMLRPYGISHVGSNGRIRVERLDGLRLWRRKRLDEGIGRGRCAAEERGQGLRRSKGRVVRVHGGGWRHGGVGRRSCGGAKDGRASGSKEGRPARLRVVKTFLDGLLGLHAVGACCRQRLRACWRACWRAVSLKCGAACGSQSDNG